MIPPHIKKYSLEKIGNKYIGYALFNSDRKIFRAEVEIDSDGNWIIRGVPFYSDGEVRLYEMVYGNFDKKRYVMFYPWDADFSGRKLLMSFPVGVGRPDVVVSYYGPKMKYGGVIKDNYIILSDGYTVEVYRKKELVALLNPENVESFILTPLGEIENIKSKD